MLFTSAATTFSALDTHEVTQVYRRDRQTGITTLISLDAGGSAGTSASVAYALSADGRYSLFATSAQNIIGSSAWQGVYQLYRHDAQTGTLELVSASTSGQPGGGSSHSAVMTPDGRHALFYSSATDLVASDANGANFHVFLRDLDSDSTVIASLAADGTPMNIPLQDVSWPPFGNCSPATLSADGRYAVFVAGSASGGYLREIHRYDRNSGMTLLSADGNTLSFSSSHGSPAADRNGPISKCSWPRMLPTGCSPTGSSVESLPSGHRIACDDRKADARLLFFPAGGSSARRRALSAHRTSQMKAPWMDCRSVDDSVLTGHRLSRKPGRDQRCPRRGTARFANGIVVLMCGLKKSVRSITPARQATKLVAAGTFTAATTAGATTPLFANGSAQTIRSVVGRAARHGPRQLIRTAA